MELQRLGDRDAGRWVGFDLLKQWISNTFHRQIVDTHPPGCPWQSLAAACRASGCRVETSDMDLEATFRTVLVQAYAKLTEAEVEAVLEAKLMDELSFFHSAMSSVEESKKHWKWYLYCLTFHSKEFSTDGESWNNVPRSNTAVARLPLDMVDLGLLARFLTAQITVSRLDEPALRLFPVILGQDGQDGQDGEDVVCLHLVVHKSLWAPVLATADWVACRIDRTRVGSIVEVHDNLPSFIEGFAGRIACVNDFDEDESCYTVCSGLQQIPLHSSQIRRVIARTSDLIWRSTDVTLDAVLALPSRSGHAPGQAPAFQGIPDSSVEFQLLLQMVMCEMGTRLRNLREKLAGRPLRPLRNRNEAPSLEEEDPVSFKELEWLRHRPPQPGEQCPSCLSLQAVEQLLKTGARVWTRCPGAVRQGCVQLKRKEFVCIVAAFREDASGTASLLFRMHTSVNQQLVGIPSDCLCLWIATQDFEPDSKWKNPHQFLQVWQGESLFMIERHRWDGWGNMRRLEEDSELTGLVPLRYLVPCVWVASLEIV